MKEIYIICDYQSRMCSKQNSIIYRSGMDKQLIKECFENNKITPCFINISDKTIYEINWRDKIVLYSSIEDHNLYYKSFFEDVIYYLKIQGAVIIPDFAFLKSNNNKVFMSQYFNVIDKNNTGNLRTQVFGCFEDLETQIDTIKFPCVVKRSDSAMSRGVYLANNKTQLMHYVKKISRTIDLKFEIKDYLRKLKHRGYKPESKYRKKFIVQEFIHGLDHDWKVLVFDNKYFVLKRNVRKNDYRASGSHRFIFTKDVPEKVLSYSKEIFEKFDVPFLSMDVGFNGTECFVFEYQGVNFGTYTMENAPYYFVFNKGKWISYTNDLQLEYVYCESVLSYIERKNYKF